MKKKRKVLVDEWQTSYRWLSTWGLAALTSAPIAYENIALLKEVVPVNAYHYGMAALAVLTFVARMVNQK